MAFKGILTCLIWLTLVFDFHLNAQILQEGFEGGTFPPTGWTVINNSGCTGGTCTWGRVTSPALVFAGSGAARSSESDNGANNNWLFTPSLNLTAGVTYSVSYQQRTSPSQGHSVSMRVTVGTAQTAMAQTTNIGNFSGLNNTNYLQRQHQFTPATSGTYFFGFHHTTDEYFGNLLIDNIEISAILPSCPAPVDSICASPSIVTYNSAGISTFIVPAGVTSLEIEVWGGGGRGASLNLIGVGGGGGGGAYTQTQTFSVNPLQILTIQVGAGSASNSTPGGDSWVSVSSMAPTLPTQGVLAKGGQSAVTNTNVTTLGGQATDGVGTNRLSGGNGLPSPNADGGMGGAGANGGSGGMGGSGVSNAVGNNGVNPGGGGGGAKRVSGTAIVNGGNGANGRVVIRYQIPAGYPVTVSGGTTQSYCNLGKALQAINAGIHTGAIQISVSADTWETQSDTLRASGSGCANYSSITLIPTSPDVKIQGWSPSALFVFDGADFVTIDGRLNGTGQPHQLTIANYNSSNAGNNGTLRFVNGATFNVIQHAVIQGSTTNSGTTGGGLGGIITFHTDANGDGNDFNIIQSCRITNAAGRRPARAIALFGSDGLRANDQIQIINNEIFDVLNDHELVNTPIYVGSGNRKVQISGNRIYESNPIAPSFSNEYYFIFIENSFGHRILQNIIGGQNASGTGILSFSPNTDQSYLVRGIHLQNNTGVAPNDTIFIEQNQIAGISLNNSSRADDCFTGISATGTAGLHLEVLNNVVGSSSQSTAISLRSVASSNGGAISYGMNLNLAPNADISRIVGNQIGGILVSNVNNPFVHRFTAMRVNQPNSSGTTGGFLVQDNVIGSTTVANSITASHNASTSSNWQTLFGLEILPGQNNTALIRNNTISELFNEAPLNNNTLTELNGIRVSGVIGNVRIIQNTIQNLKATDLNNSNDPNNVVTQASLFGIKVFNVGNNTIGTPINEVSRNVISNLEHINTTATSPMVVGLFYGGATGNAITSVPTSTMEGNYIFNLSSFTSSPSARIRGIQIYSGNAANGGSGVTRRLVNNVIQLGASINTNHEWVGIYENGNQARTHQYLFNTIYIGGSTLNGTSPSMAMRINGSNVSYSRDIRNNILVNDRSTGLGNGISYALYFENTSGSNLLNFNNYRVVPGNGVLGFWNGSAVSSLPLLLGQDAQSLDINPLFLNQGGNVATDYISNASLTGTQIAFVTLDFLGNSRANPPQMGAFELNASPLLNVITSSQPSAGGNTTGDGTYALNSSVTVTATPDSGYVFLYWTENGVIVSSDSSYTFNITTNRNLVAVFEPTAPSQFNVITSANPSNGGVTAGDGLYPLGLSVTVTATENVGFSFVNWTENGVVVSSDPIYIFTINSNRNLVANFNAVPEDFTVITSSNPVNGGITNGDGVYQGGTLVTVTATANSGFTFLRWSENGTQVSVDPIYSFTINSNRNLVAEFDGGGGGTLFNVTTEAIPFNGQTVGSTTGDGSYAGGSTVTISAQSIVVGHRFLRWLENGQIVSTDSVYNFTINRDHNFEAEFEFVESVRSIDFVGDIQVFPNPTKSSITLSNLPSKGNFHLTVTDVLGKFMFMIELNSNEKGESLVQFPDLLPGTYLMSLQNHQIIYQHKIIVY